VVQVTDVNIKPTVDMCPYCYDLLAEAINEILNAILNGGVIGGCTDVCALLVDPILQVACNLVCDYVGIDAFIAAINVTDPDPIYACQVMDLCPVVNGGMVTISQATVSPKSGPSGTTFNFNLVYLVTAATGPGLIAVTIIPPDALPFGEASFEEGQPTGKYDVQFQMQATPSEQEPFNPGTYYAAMAICEGDCTTDHEWGGVYASVNVTFSITQ